MGETVKQSENVLSSRIWNDRNTGYPISINITSHSENFNNQGRVLPNETSRVRYLLKSIQMLDLTICSPKATIMTDQI